MDFTDSEDLDNEESEELKTVTEVVEKLEEVWMNEKLSPELLDTEDDLVECLLDQIQHMENGLLKIKKDDFRLVFHKMELDRIKFMVNSYLRTRLEKIEKFAAFLLKREEDDPTTRNQMSELERKFAQEHVSNIKNYLHGVALSQMPSNMQTLNLEEVGPKPKLNSSVFIRVNRECRGVVLQGMSSDGEDEIVDLPVGSQHILPYKPIADLLKSGSVQLI